MDSAHRGRSKLAVAIAILAALYWLAMFVGTHVPVTPRPAEHRNSLDKLQHLAAFAGLAFLLCAAGGARGISFRWLFMGVLVVIAVYGVVDEITQAFVPHRETDLRDWLADMLGAGVGVAAFAVAWPLIAVCRCRRGDSLTL